MTVVSGGVAYGLATLAKVRPLLPVLGRPHAWSTDMGHIADLSEIPRPAPPTTLFDGFPIDLGRDYGAI